MRTPLETALAAASRRPKTASAIPASTFAADTRPAERAKLAPSPPFAAREVMSSPADVERLS